MTINFSESLPQEKGAIMVLEEAMADDNLSLLEIGLVGLATALFIKKLPNNGEYPPQGRIGSNRENRPTSAEIADKIAEEMLKAGKSPQDIGAAVAAVLEREG